MTLLEVQDAFTNDEMMDIEAAAQERGLSVYELIHQVVLDDLVR